MTKLERAFAEAVKLQSPGQEALAESILEELASEKCWTEDFANSAAALAGLADEALSEHRAGNTRSLDPEHL